MADESNNDEENVEVDSEEDDEDYVPGDDGADENGSAHGVGKDAIDEVEAQGDECRLSVTKQKAVDDAFMELFGFVFTQDELPQTISSKSNSKIPISSSPTLQKSQMKRHRVLSRIFGRAAASKLLCNAKYVASSAGPKRPIGSSKGGGSNFRLERRVIKEVKRFAGQEISVERIEMVPVFFSGSHEISTSVKAEEMGESSVTAIDSKVPIHQPIGPTSAAGATSTTSAQTGDVKGPTPKGLDNLLDQISRPEKLSTISKSHADWDLFKSKGLSSKGDSAMANVTAEELERRAAGNEAYLVKKDFLNRVDLRRFELEKKERAVKRAKREGR